MNEPREYRRNLPHIQPEDGVFFITFRLNGSLPVHVIAHLKDEYDAIVNNLKRKYNGPILSVHLSEESNIYFNKFDSLLDSHNRGPLYLKNENICNVVKEALHFRDNKVYSLLCYCIMPNHVHLIIYKTKRVLFRILQSLKRHSGREANKILKREGSFWQKESYDHLIRSRNELASTIDYVLNNPVKAGFVSDWKEWKHSWCRPNFK